MNRKNTMKQVGLWLDHAKAHFVDISKGPAVVETVFSEKESQVRIDGETASGARLGNNRSTNNEHHKHNREQKLKNEYFKVLTDRLKEYDDIFLFGPATAKDELYNKLKSEKQFAEKVINVEPSDQLTENQLTAKVKQFFNV